MTALARYVQATRELARAQRRAARALTKVIKAGDRVTWEKGRGIQSGVVLSVYAPEYDHDLARCMVRSSTGKEYALAAYWITQRLIAVDRQARR
jgi:hypothetical protein